MMKVAKYRKRPVEINAIQWNGENISEIKAFVGKNLYIVEDSPKYLSMKIKTIEGDMEIGVGDYIIRGVKGEFYPCKEDIFYISYEECVGARWVLEYDKLDKW